MARLVFASLVTFGILIGMVVGLVLAAMVAAGEVNFTVAIDSRRSMGGYLVLRELKTTAGSLRAKPFFCRSC